MGDVMGKSTKLLIAIFAIVLPAAAVGVGLIGSSTTGLPPEAMRGELAQEIVSQWSSYVEHTYGTDSADWADRMAPTFEQTDIANMERAASAVDFQSMSAALIGDGSLQASGDPGTTALGSIGSDLVFTPVFPCRILDTRLVGGAIPGNGTRGFRGFTATDFTSQGGFASDCGIPLNAAVLTVKLTATNTVSTGHFLAYPTGQPKPLASSLNYQAGVNTSNTAYIELCRPGCVTEFTIFALTQANAVVDVTGYYIEPEATALDCTVAEETGNLDLLGGLQARSVDCPAGYTATGGGCGGPLGIGVSNSQPVVSAGQPTGWSCDLVGSLLSVIAYQVNATCCRTPGR